MNEIKRQTTLAHSMIEQESKTVAKYKVRSFSYGSLQLAYLLNLTLFTGAIQSEMSESEIQRQISTFVWMQSAPQDEVIHAVTNGGAGTEVLKFALTIDLKDLPELLAEVNKIGDQISANEVRVESKHKSTEEEAPPGQS
jgi:hypothetical protein